VDEIVYDHAQIANAVPTAAASQNDDHSSSPVSAATKNQIAINIAIAIALILCGVNIVKITSPRRQGNVTIIVDRCQRQL